MRIFECECGAEIAVDKRTVFPIDCDCDREITNAEVEAQFKRYDQDPQPKCPACGRPTSDFPCRHCGEQIEWEAANKLSQGQVAVLKVDPVSNELVDLYLPREAWRYLAERFKGNKVVVTIRGPHDLHRDAFDAIMEGHMPVLKEIFGRGA